jgi:hypothetical protein
MMEVFKDLEQGTEEWRSIRCGLPTASMFATILAKGRDGGASATRRTYLHKLAGEIITGEPAESFSNHHTERGHVHEMEARQLYAFVADEEPEQIGFIRNGRKGCSPDALIGGIGLLELKSKLPHLVIDLILKDRAPSEHIAQVQGQLWVAEREWCDICIYWPRMPIFIKRIARDESYIRKLSDAVDLFNEELDEVVAKIKAYGLKDAA